MGGTAPFNESQQRRILANAEYADKLLADIENILMGAEAGRLFRRHHPDVTPQQARLVRSSIAQFRRQLGGFRKRRRWTAAGGGLSRQIQRGRD